MLPFNPNTRAAPMSNTERQRRFRERNPGYYQRLHARRRGQEVVFSQLKAVVGDVEVAHKLAVAAERAAALVGEAPVAIPGIAVAPPAPVDVSPVTAEGAVPMPRVIAGGAVPTLAELMALRDAAMLAA